MVHDKQITARIPAELDLAITELANELNLTRSEVMRNALTAGVLEGKATARRLKNPAFRMLVRTLLALDSDPDQLDLFNQALAAGAFPDA